MYSRPEATIRDIIMRDSGASQRCSNRGASDPEELFDPIVGLCRWRCYDMRLGYATHLTLAEWPQIPG